MAISAKSAGSWAASNATTQTVTLPTHAAGDMLIVRAGCKPYTATPSISTSGWQAVGTGYANGATGAGNGTGSVIVRAWWKVAASASETNPVIDWGTTSAPGQAVAVCYQKGASEIWDTPVGGGGGDDTARTSQTATIGSHISVTSGDMVDFFVISRDDSAITVPTITQAGVTYDTVTVYPTTAFTTATSNDGAASGGYRSATSGTSSAAAVVTHTNAVTESGAAWQTRLRLAPPDATVTPTVIAAVAATPATTENVGWGVSPSVAATTVSTPTAAAWAGADIAPGVVAAVAAVPTPTVLASSTVSPASLSTAVAVPTPTAFSDAATAPAVIAAATNVPTPIVEAGAPPPDLIVSTNLVMVIA